MVDRNYDSAGTRDRRREQGMRSGNFDLKSWMDEYTQENALYFRPDCTTVLLPIMNIFLLSRL